MADRVAVQCCVVGGGPAGMVLALLARAGIEVLVLERHADFLRDFRGDTMHPSTLGLMDELGLLEELLAIPHHRIDHVDAWVDDDLVTLADFTHLPGACQFGTMLPQWDFLDFVAREAARYPTFSLRRRADVTELIHDGDRIAGVVAETAAGRLEVHADLVVGCDGRSSVVRERSALAVRELGAPMDVFWFRLSRRPDDPTDAFLRIQAGRFLVVLGRPEHWQCGFVIPKDGAEALRRRGIEALREEIASSVPFLADRVDEVATWDDVPLLSVRVDRLERWYRPGLLCIGDAAHAMSPVGGVGINLAIQDAVATANLLVGPLRRGRPTVRDLRRVQRRRTFPTRAMQRVQVVLADRALRPVLDANRNPAARGAWLLRRVPRLARVTGRLVGLGFRAEHVLAADRPR